MVEKINLAKVPVIFRDVDHTYWYGDKQLYGTSGLYRRHIKDEYDGVPQGLMETAAHWGSMVHDICEQMDMFGVTLGAFDNFIHSLQIPEHPDNEKKVFKPCKNYLKLKEECGLQIIESEYMISDLEYFATKIDKLLYTDDINTVDLGDIKTSYELKKESISWQLSISAYLFEQQNPNIKVRNLYGIWLRHDKKVFQLIERKPDDKVKQLLDAERFGLPFEEQSYDIQSIEQLERQIVFQENALKILKQEKESLLDRIEKQMAANGDTKWENDIMIITRIAETNVQTIDTKKLKEQYPDIAEQMNKTTKKKAFVKIKLKNNSNLLADD